jgi:hypothetical protein
VNIVGEFLTDVSSWRLLVCYLDTAGLDVTPAFSADVALFAEAGARALPLGLPFRREVRTAAMFVEANAWLNTASAVSVADDDVDLLGDAAVMVEALCPERHRPAALQLLDVGPLLVERDRQRRRHPIRAFRRPAWPPVIGPTTWQQSLWWRRAQQSQGTAPMVHAAASIAAAVWSRLDAVHNPIGIREELRRRGNIESGSYSLHGDLPVMTGGTPPQRDDCRDPRGKTLPASVGIRPRPALRPGVASFTV